LPIGLISPRIRWRLGQGLCCALDCLLSLSAVRSFVPSFTPSFLPSSAWRHHRRDRHRRSRGDYSPRRLPLGGRLYGLPQIALHFGQRGLVVGCCGVSRSPSHLISL
jgi:hypothetical protein